jgi:hypothetical protein
MADVSNMPVADMPVCSLQDSKTVRGLGRSSKMRSHAVRFMVNALLHALILTSILTVAFAVIISRVEKESVTSEVHTSISEGMRTGLEQQHAKDPKKFCEAMALLTTPGTAAGGGSILDAMEANYDRPSPEITVQNDLTRNMAASLVIGLAAVVLFTWVSLSLTSCHQAIMIELITENIMVFIFIAAIEVMFFLFAARKFIPVTPSFMQREVIEQLRSIFSTQPINGPSRQS